MRNKRNKGQNLVEFALMLPILLTLLLGIVEFGFAFNAHVTLVHAAREGARYAAIHYNTTSETAQTDIENIIKNAAVGLDSSNINFNPRPEWNSATNKVTINVGYKFTLIDPFLPAIIGKHINMHASAVMAIE